MSRLIIIVGVCASAACGQILGLGDERTLAREQSSGGASMQSAGARQTEMGGAREATGGAHGSGGSKGGSNTTGGAPIGGAHAGTVGFSTAGESGAPFGGGGSESGGAPSGGSHTNGGSSSLGGAHAAGAWPGGGAASGAGGDVHGAGGDDTAGGTLAVSDGGRVSQGGSSQAGGPAGGALGTGGATHAGGVPSTGGGHATALYSQDFEKSAGCLGEVPPLSEMKYKAPLADCDFEKDALSGNQSVHFGDSDASIVCQNCWPAGEPELWLEYKLRVDRRYTDGVWFNIAYGSTDDTKTATGPAVAVYLQELKVFCFEAGDERSGPIPTQIQLGSKYLITQHYSWVTGKGELWVRALNQANVPSSPRGAPDQNIQCAPGLSQPTAFWSLAYAGSGGEGLLDDIRFAREESAISP